jgi:hypothetical protein
MGFILDKWLKCHLKGKSLLVKTYREKTLLKDRGSFLRINNFSANQ